MNRSRRNRVVAASIGAVIGDVIAVVLGVAVSVGPASAQSGAAGGRAPGAEFRDCPQCPEMVVIPAGHFIIGSSAEEKAWAVSHGASKGSVTDEAPQRSVTVRSFALGKYDVTRAEYAEFARATGRGAGDGCRQYDGTHLDNSVWPKQASASWEHPGFDQSDRDPVVCVSWPDAWAYVGWLNGKIQRPGSGAIAARYRLPSEAEWEYAARGGRTTRFWWGDDDAKAARYAWFKGNAGGRTHPVGEMPANGFGLYDMAGNVWQWNEDCYAESYPSAPGDGSAIEAGGPACLRVDRGSSWAYPSWLLRAAARERNTPDMRDVVLGFRVAKTLP